MCTVTFVGDARYISACIMFPGAIHAVTYIVMRFLFLFVCFISPIPLVAQIWHVNVAAGTSFGRTIPAGSSTERSPELRYVLMGTGAFANILTQLDAGRHYGFSLQGQLAITPSGIRHTPLYIAGPVTRAVDEIFTRSLMLGCTWHTAPYTYPVTFAATIRGGVAYSTLSGLQLRTSSGLVEQYSSGHIPTATRLTGKEVMDASLSPMVGITLQAGPNIPGTTIANRLMVNVSANALLRNPYEMPSRVMLNYAVNPTGFGTTAQYHGAVIMCQFGIEYVLFRQRDKYS